ncbi:hypothetical protein [Pseudenhygromyxa sp. WMMC2535]|nr:hypothetical protein [Pseudenhygromyxa sp. WMMC2535]
MTQFSASLIAALIYVGLGVCVLGISILLVLLVRDWKDDELW